MIEKHRRKVAVAVDDVDEGVSHILSGWVDRRHRIKQRLYGLVVGLGASLSCLYQLLNEAFLDCREAHVFQRSLGLDVVLSENVGDGDANAIFDHVELGGGLADLHVAFGASLADTRRFERRPNSQ